MNESITPLITVIIPTFNHANFLKRALQSVCDQTYINWEIIIIDNYSTDKTDSIIRSFTDKRIKSLKINNNGLIAASRNMGIRAAKGEWIAFLDSDDWWSSNKLEICLSYMGADIDFIYHNLDVIYDKPSFFKKRTSCSKVGTPVLKSLLCMGNPIANSGVVVRKELLVQVGGISEEVDMVAAEDYNTWLKISAITDAFKYIPTSLGGCLIHDGGMSQRDMSIPHRYAVDAFKSVLTNDELKYLEKDIFYISGRHKYLNRELFDARVDLMQSLSFKKLYQSLKAIYMTIAIIFSR
jgi:glycosyltransferase involved in cell wall biosynthesis